MNGFDVAVLNIRHIALSNKCTIKYVACDLFVILSDIDIKSLHSRCLSLEVSLSATRQFTSIQGL